MARLMIEINDKEFEATDCYYTLLKEVKDPVTIGAFRHKIRNMKTFIFTKEEVLSIIEKSKKKLYDYKSDKNQTVSFYYKKYVDTINITQETFAQRVCHNGIEKAISMKNHPKSKDVISIMDLNKLWKPSVSI